VFVSTAAPQGQQLWHLLQISDQFFPTGGYAFSHALETYSTGGIVHDRASCYRLLENLCWHAIGPCDLVFCAQAYRLAVGGGQTLDTLTALIELDQLLTVHKVPRELRQESQHTGQAFLRAAMTLDPVPLVQAFWQHVRDGTTPGQHAIVFGLVAQGLGCDQESTLLAYLYTVLTGLVAAALRLVPLGQSDGQRLLHELAPLSRALIAQYGALSPEEAWSSTPGLDIRSMQHERLYSRLCRS
jgi:urease accessory protein